MQMGLTEIHKFSQFSGKTTVCPFVATCTEMCTFFWSCPNKKCSHLTSCAFQSHLSITITKWQLQYSTLDKNSLLSDRCACCQSERQGNAHWQKLCRRNGSSTESRPPRTCAFPACGSDHAPAKTHTHPTAPCSRLKTLASISVDRENTQLFRQLRVQLKAENWKQWSNKIIDSFLWNWSDHL